MLKLKIDTLDGVDEALRDFYEKSGDGYQLKVDGMEDTGALKRAKDREKQAKQQALQELADMREELDGLRSKMQEGQDNKARESGDVDALEKSWQTKYQKRESELQQQIEAMQGNITGLLVDRTAESLAAELAVQGSAPVLVPHIKSRLRAEQRDGKFDTVVLDGEGNPSALSVDELKQEIAGNAAFAPLIAGSKGSGSGASKTAQGGSAANSGKPANPREQRAQEIREKYPDL